MVTNNVDFLQRVIIAMAKEHYQNEVVICGLEDQIIGPNLEWESKEAWISDYIEQQFNMVKTDIIVENRDKGHDRCEEADIVTYENTIAMRLYSLDIGQSFELTNFTKITRMPGGWAFEKAGKQPAFIPFSEEFNHNGGTLSKEITAMSYITDEVE